MTAVRKTKDKDTGFRHNGFSSSSWQHYYSSRNFMYEVRDMYTVHCVSKMDSHQLFNRNSSKHSPTDFYNFFWQKHYWEIEQSKAGLFFHLP